MESVRILVALLGVLAVLFVASVGAQGTTGECTLTGGETVKSGWAGADTGSNSCNDCTCNDGMLLCTLALCPPQISLPLPSLCVCTLQYEPVCGADGFTYGNDCQAECENVSYVPGTCEEVCSLEPEVGPGRAAVERFFFNETSLMCEPFIYGNVGGNANNFETVEACEGSCTTQLCMQLPEVGPGRAAFERYFYNATSVMCEPFIYGGVGGNPNNFETIADCEDFCTPTDGCMLDDGSFVEEGYSGPGTGENYCNSCSCAGGALLCTLAICEPVCSLKPEVGMGRAAFERYFYNATSAMCEPFIYGGVDGNPNNFETIQECEDYCMPSLCVCQLIFDPVCGEDGTTYGNACQAECEGVVQYTAGECSPAFP